MNRLLLTLSTLLLSVSLAGAAPLSPADKASSAGYVAQLRNSDGGFRGAATAGPSQLGAATSGIRATKYLQGELKDERALRRWVLSCYDPMSGGFSDVPGGAPDVRSTAMGLMALADLRVEREGQRQKAAAYLAQNAKSLPEIYIAAAAMDAAGVTSAAPKQQWTAAWEAVRNADGAYGKSLADTAGAVITVLRLGGTVDRRTQVVSALKAGQQTDGGFPNAEGKSDLSTTYRVMRAFRMMMEKPDVAKVRQFIAKCRNSDSGYGPTPGAPSTGSATYNAAIVSQWLDEMEK